MQPNITTSTLAASSPDISGVIQRHYSTHWCGPATARHPQDTGDRQILNGRKSSRTFFFGSYSKLIVISVLMLPMLNIETCV